MYTVIRLTLVLVCLTGVLYLVIVKKKYKGDTAGRENIIDYFKERGAISIESGIRIKDLPIEIAKSNYLLLMVQDGTLVFKKGKYYLGEKTK